MAPPKGARTSRSTIDRPQDARLGASRHTNPRLTTDLLRLASWHPRSELSITGERNRGANTHTRLIAPAGSSVGSPQSRPPVPSLPWDKRMPRSAACEAGLKVGKGRPKEETQGHRGRVKAGSGSGTTPVWGVDTGPIWETGGD